MNDIQLFKNDQFGEVRVIELNVEPLFCLSDVCNILGLRQGDVRQRLDEGGGFNPTPSNSRRHSTGKLRE